MRSATPRYLALFGALFLISFATGVLVYAVGPIVASTLTAAPWLLPAAGLVSLVGVLIEILDDIRSAKEPPQR